MNGFYVLNWFVLYGLTLAMRLLKQSLESDLVVPY